MLAEPRGYARQNIAPLVLEKVWAARQHRPTLMVVSSCARTRGRVLADQQVGPTILANGMKANNHE
jgi:hypothetical protein